MANLTYDYQLKPWEIFGGKRPFFVKYADVIADVIKDFGLKPIQREVAAPTLRMSEVMKATPTSEMMAYVDPSVFGGKRFAHLHYRGEIYMLNREQWQTFTGRVKDDLLKRLEMANAISVEQFQDLSDAIDAIA
jgi:hypothetical protein